MSSEIASTSQAPNNGLNNLALLLKATNRLADAEPLMRRALAIDEVRYGAVHPELATDLNNLDSWKANRSRCASRSTCSSCSTAPVS